MANPGDDALLRELLATFQAEAAEHLQTLNQTLLKLERQPDEDQRQALLQEAFRAAHSLKGAARAVSLPEIEMLSNSMESVLQEARDANLVLKPNTCDVLYDTLDALQRLLDGKDVELEKLKARLAVLSGESVSLSGASTPVATAQADEPLPKNGEPENGTNSPTDGPTPGLAMAAEETIRVAVDKLDNLMAQAGELLVSRISTEQRLSEIQQIRHDAETWPRTWREIKNLLQNVDGDVRMQLEDVLTRHYTHLQVFARDVDNLDRSLGHDASRLSMVSNQLQDEVRRVRMVPFQQLVLPLERAVRDAAHSEDKQATLQVVGADVELDKKVLEMLKDPLLHLMRNAVGHGIELPAVREKLGKPAEGTVTVTVQQRGSEVRITVSDDGQGFDLAGLRKASTKHKGLKLDDNSSAEEVISLAFLPGMTTSQAVTAISGRGVGLDVVRQQLESLQGRVEVESVAQEGTSFQLAVPASLTMTRGLLIRAGGRSFVLPLLAIQKIILPEDVFNVEGQPMIMVDDSPLTLVPLATALGLPVDESARAEEMLAVVIGVAEQRLALLVDDVETELELAVKSFSAPLKRVRNVTGAALLGTGQPVVVLNPADLVKAARGTQMPALFFEHGVEDDQGPAAHILVVDDSITTRTLEKNILEAAGYRISIATDGIEALTRLEQSADIALVVSDIQMPVMDGIDLTTHLRADDDYQELPIILVTSLESHEDREKGMMAGANAYIVKRGFDQAELLATIEQYL
ncbi:response regulator [Chloroflexota bacterium]